MDTPSHGLWSYVLWHAAPFPFLAVVFGMLPDLVSLWPSGIYSTLRGDWRAQRGQPAWLQWWRRHSFPLTHSLVIALFVSALVFLVWGNQWWVLAWPLHIVVDIFSHPKEKATPFLWPLFTYRVNGVRWWSRQFIALNAVLLVAAWWQFVR